VVLCVVFSTCSNVWGPLNNIYDSKVAVPAPISNVRGGTYGQDQQVTLGCVFPGAVIHYTIDGSNPTSSSPQYSLPILVSGVGARMTVKSVAKWSGKPDSEVQSETYVLDLPISTIAGNGTGGYGGDGGPAAQAIFNAPYRVACDAAGNIYVSDHRNNRIRKIDASTGLISVFAGGGSGYGEGGPAINASLGFTAGISVASGFLYLIDFTGCVVRKINLTTNIITTVAGNQISGYGGDGGLATLAQLNMPWALALDQQENVYIADSSNNRIRMVDRSTGKISTIAGNGAAGYAGDNGAASSSVLNNPSGIALDALGNCYIADTSNFVVRKINAATGMITTIAGGGSGQDPGNGVAATSVGLGLVSDLTFNSRGELFIASTGCVHKLDLSTGLIYRVVGNGTGTSGYGGDQGPASAAQLGGYCGVGFDPNGNLYIADGNNNRVRMIPY
jgi:sugar lactone lactonase YvrE